MRIGPELLKLIDQVRLWKQDMCICSVISDTKILSHLLTKALLENVRSLVMLYNEFNTEENSGRQKYVRNLNTEW
jgi:hypothetical protein